MRLKKVLVPELFKGNRGEKENLKLIRTAISLFRETEEGLAVILPKRHPPEDQALFNQIVKDQSAGLFFRLGRSHKIERAATYHVCRDFLLALHKIPDRDIKLAYLPDSFTAYVSLPDEVVFDKDGDSVTGFYVKIGIVDKLQGFLPEFIGERLVSFSYQIGKDGSFDINRLGHFVHKLTGDESVSDMLYGKRMLVRRGTVEQQEEVHGQADMIKTFFNILLYINSSDPELLLLTPSCGRTNSQKKRLEVQNHGNQCSIPVIAINWNYVKNAKNYFDGSVRVRTHPRWQPCGVDFSQVKLIWVKEHQRTMKLRVKGEENEEG